MYVSILVTGSRKWLWIDREPIRRALVATAAELDVAELCRVIVVHGGQGRRDRAGQAVDGADLVAHDVALELGMAADPHPARWRECDWTCRPGHRKTGPRSGQYCPTAGFRRNQAMVDLHPDRFLGFPIGASPGTRDCMRRAREAGIREGIYEQVESGVLP